MNRSLAILAVGALNASASGQFLSGDLGAVLQIRADPLTEEQVEQSRLAGLLIGETASVLARGAVHSAVYPSPAAMGVGLVSATAALEATSVSGEISMGCALNESFGETVMVHGLAGLILEFEAAARLDVLTLSSVGPDEGIFTASLFALDGPSSPLDLTPTGGTVSVRLDEGRYQLMLMWDMLAINPAGGSSSLLDLPGPFAFDATLTPAPGTIGLLALAGLVVARRRRG